MTDDGSDSQRAARPKRLEAPVLFRLCAFGVLAAIRSALIVFGKLDDQAGWLL